MFIYGGFSFDCTTACEDMWVYDIPFASLSYYPTRVGKVTNYGNHWAELSVTSGPGGRFRHS